MNETAQHRPTPTEAPIRVGLFSDLGAAEKAVQQLLDAGFTNREITVVCSDDQRESHFRQFEHQEPAGRFTDRAEVAGGAIGAVLGGLIGLTGIVATGGIGLLASGAILAAGAGMTGTFVGAMMTRGVEKELANFYDQEVVRGNILVAGEAHGVDRHEKLAVASKIFQNLGAKPMSLGEG